MPFSQFTTRALLLFSILGMLIFGLSFLEKFQPFIFVSWTSLTYMTVVIHISYYFVWKGTQQKEHKDFLKSVALGFAVKLILAILFLIMFKLIFEPESKLFVLPFFAVYFSYTFLLSKAIMKKT
ncbi:MAG: hypothetical protein HKN92_07840 [Chitinophagales bacterium]|nr:hypothetical protein [Chitinophagales bacterium]